MDKLYIMYVTVILCNQSLFHCHLVKCMLVHIVVTWWNDQKLLTMIIKLTYIMIHNDVLDAGQASMSRSFSSLSLSATSTVIPILRRFANQILVPVFPRIYLTEPGQGGCIYYCWGEVYWWSNASLYWAEIYFCTVFVCVPLGLYLHLHGWRNWVVYWILLDHINPRSACTLQSCPLGGADRLGLVD